MPVKNSAFRVIYLSGKVYDVLTHPIDISEDKPGELSPYINFLVLAKAGNESVNMPHPLEDVTLKIIITPKGKIQKAWSTHNDEI